MKNKFRFGPLLTPSVEAIFGASFAIFSKKFLWWRGKVFEYVKIFRKPHRFRVFLPQTPRNLCRGGNHVRRRLTILEVWVIEKIMRIQGFNGKSYRKSCQGKKFWPLETN